MNKLDEKSILLVSTGVLAGLGTCINVISVPSILASSDPLPVWKVTYTRGKNISMSALFVASVTGVALYLKEENLGYLLVASLSAFLMPFTIFAILPTNKTLLAIEDQDKTEKNKEIRGLIKKWEKMQYVRTFVGVAAFVTAIAVICKK